MNEIEEKKVEIEKMNEEEKEEEKEKIKILVENLEVFYDSEMVLKNINIKIPEKKITAILGPSGCGKSTFLKTLNRIIEIQNVKIKGNVFLDGKSIFDIDPIILRKKVGIIFQKPQPFPMSIYDNIAYGLKIYGEKNIKEKVEEVLRKVGLWDEVKDKLWMRAEKLSLGQQQRLTIARVLALNPEVILADEPTSSLDPVSSEKIEEIFLELKNEYTIVIVTHNINQAKKLADYIAFFYLGEIIEQGYAHKIFVSPKNQKTKEFIKAKRIEDLRGLKCPLNLINVKKILKEIEKGDILVVLVDDETAVKEMPKAIELEGYSIKEIRKRNEHWEITIETE